MVILTTKVKFLGQGQYGTVTLWKGYNEEKRPHLYVVKDMVTGSETMPLERILREIFIVYYLRPHCSKYFLCFSDFNIANNDVQLVTKYIPGSFELASYLQNNKLSILEKLFIMQTLAVGLSKMHSLGVSHRDIKATNILYSPKNGIMCKYIDYGLACMSPPDFMNTVMTIGRMGKLPSFITMADMQNVIRTCPEGAVGSPVYMAPEIIRDEIKSFQDLLPADVWSLGVLFYIIAFDAIGNLPFTEGVNNPMQLLYRLGGLTNGASVDMFPPRNVSPDVLVMFSRIIDPMWKVASGRANCKQVIANITNTLIHMGRGGELNTIKDDLILKIKVNPNTPYMSVPGKYSKTIQILYPRKPSITTSSYGRERYARDTLGLPPNIPRPPKKPRENKRFFAPPSVAPKYNPTIRHKKFFPPPPIQYPLLPYDRESQKKRRKRF